MSDELVLVFERPNPPGWDTVVFPKIHDQSVNLEIWWNQVNDWLEKEGLNPRFSCFAHAVGKKKGPDAVSPVFFFKDHMYARRLSWRFNGELVNGNTQ